MNGEKKITMGGPDFRRWRRAADMTQVKCARLFCVDRMTIHAWERRGVPQKYAGRIAELHEIDRIRHHE